MPKYKNKQTLKSSKVNYQVTKFYNKATNKNAFLEQDFDSFSFVPQFKYGDPTLTTIFLLCLVANVNANNNALVQNDAQSSSSDNYSELTENLKPMSEINNATLGNIPLGLSHAISGATIGRELQDNPTQLINIGIKSAEYTSKVIKTVPMETQALHINLQEKISEAINKLKNYYSNEKGMPKFDADLLEPSIEEKRAYPEALIPDFTDYTQEDIISLYDFPFQPKNIGSGGTNYVYKVLKNNKEIALRLQASSSGFPLHIKAHILSKIMEDMNIAKYHPTILGIFRGPCVESLPIYACKVKPNTKVLYTEMEYIQDVIPHSNLKVADDSMIFENILNEFCTTKIAGFSIGDIVSRHYLSGKANYHRAYHVKTGQKNEDIYFFNENLYITTRIDLDTLRKYDSKKLFHFQDDTLIDIAQSDSGKKILQLKNIR